MMMMMMFRRLVSSDTNVMLCLMFGISSAPEKYQQIVRDVPRGCKGVLNIADDIIVHGKTMEEHDKRLHCMLCTLQKRGMTLNPNKCEFRLPS